MNQRIPPYLQNIKFSTNKLNSSQKEAIKKALYSDRTRCCNNYWWARDRKNNSNKSNYTTNLNAD